MKEETLSDKAIEDCGIPLFHYEDVKEFIKKLKEDLCFCEEIETDEETPECSICYSIRKLAGDELTKEQEADE